MYFINSILGGIPSAVPFTCSLSILRFSYQGMNKIDILFLLLTQELRSNFNYENVIKKSVIRTEQ